MVRRGRRKLFWLVPPLVAAAVAGVQLFRRRRELAAPSWAPAHRRTVPAKPDATGPGHPTEPSSRLRVAEPPNISGDAPPQDMPPSRADAPAFSAERVERTAAPVKPAASGDAVEAREPVERREPAEPGEPADIAELVEVGDVRDLTVDAARGRLVRAGFRVRRRRVPAPDAEPGRVVRQDPEPGTRVPHGSLVVLSIAAPGLTVAP